jgi:ACS family D-galactonate transporter-like MFS transporter
MQASMSSRRKNIPTSLLIVLLLLALSAFINYVDRGNLSIAAPLLKDELHISASQLGVLLSAFFWTYACLQPFSGWLVDRLNVNLVFAGGFFIWSGATAATGLVHTFAALMILRLLVGMGESVTYPSYGKILALNFEEEQRGFANAVISAGQVLGPGLGMLFGGMLVGRFGWRPFFLGLGLISLLWLFPWARWMPKKRHSGTALADAPSLGEFLRLRSAWGTSFGLFCSNYVNYFLITWLPFYLVREQHFSMDNMAKIGGIAYLIAACLATLTGWFSDRWIASGSTPTLVRKTVIGGGLALVGVFVGFAAMGGSYSIVALILGVAFFGVANATIWAVTQTLAGPQAAGRWTGFQNFIGNFAGVVAPALTGVVLDRTGKFYWAFVILSAVAFTGTACFVFVVGRIEPVIWRKSLDQEQTCLPQSSDGLFGKQS